MVIKKNTNKILHDFIIENLNFITGTRNGKTKIALPSSKVSK